VDTGMARREKGQPRRRREAPARPGRSPGTFDLAPVRCTGPADPPLLVNNIRLTKTFRVVIGGDGAQFWVTPGVLISWIPGGAAMWERIRIEKISVYREAAAEQQGTTKEVDLVVWTDGDQTTPAVRFLDRGVAGARLAAIHFKLGALTRMSWFVKDSVARLFAVNASEQAGETSLQFTVELMSVQK